MSEESHYVFNPIIAIVYCGVVLITLYFMSHDSSDSHEDSREKVIVYSAHSRALGEIFNGLSDYDYQNPTDSTGELPKKDLRPVTTTRASQNSDSIFFAAVIAQSPEYGHPVKKTIIRYYAKERDNNHVFNLDKYGFYIHERPSPLRGTHQSNMIHVGDSVSNKDVLLVGYKLISAGLSIKDISLSREHAGWKSNAIEIGTDTTIVSKKNMTLNDLRRDWGQM